VLTGAGALLVISPLTFLIGLVTLSIAILTSRFVSLGSIIGSLTTIICGVLFYFIGHVNPSFFGTVTLAQLVFMVVGPAIVILVHYDNIGRLLSGTERKLGQKVAVEEGTSPTNSSSSNAQA
jgi:acyl phosphate:glycerol-3-phosphate acyltransferase